MFSQFLWKSTFIFSDSHEKFSLVLWLITSLALEKCKKGCNSRVQAEFLSYCFPDIHFFSSKHWPLSLPVKKMNSFAPPSLAKNLRNVLHCKYLVNWSYLSFSFFCVTIDSNGELWTHCTTKTKKCLIGTFTLKCFYRWVCLSRDFVKKKNLLIFYSCLYK